MTRKDWDDGIDSLLSYAIILLLVLILAMAYYSRAHAAGTTATVSWQAPIEYLDGVALPASDIASYTVRWRGDVSGQKTVAGNVLETVVNVPCGGMTFTVLVTLTASARVPNESSQESNGVPYATGVECRTPNPPGAVTVR